MRTRLVWAPALAIAGALWVACFEPPEQRRDAGEQGLRARNLQGCHSPGDAGLVGFRGEAPDAGLCASVVIVESFGDPDPELEVQGWRSFARGVEDMPCERWGGPAQPKRSLRGSVTFDATQDDPPPATIDVWIGTGLSAPDEIRLQGRVETYDVECE